MRLGSCSWVFWKDQDRILEVFLFNGVPRISGNSFIWLTYRFCREVLCLRKEECRCTWWREQLQLQRCQLVNLYNFRAPFMAVCILQFRPWRWVWSLCYLLGHLWKVQSQKPWAGSLNRKGYFQVLDHDVKLQHWQDTWSLQSIV